MDNLVATISQLATGERAYDIAFPNLGIFIETLKNSIRIGNFTIAYYGIIIAVAMLIGFSISLKLAKKIKLNEDNIYDIFILVIILAIIGARAYYVIFNWDYYQIRPQEIIDVRAGGLAVFGGIIASLIGIIVYCKIKKVDVVPVLDIAVPGLAIGQAIGRYGNFFNMEAYGTYTNNILAMRMNMKYLETANIDFEQMLNIIEDKGARYIQAHPTFFYESTLNLILFAILLLIFFKKYKFKGQLFATYLIGYGIIRFFVESLRTDSLMLGSIKVSQLVAILCLIAGIVIYTYNRKYLISKDDIKKVKVKKKTIKKIKEKSE